MLKEAAVFLFSVYGLSSIRMCTSVGSLEVHQVLHCRTLRGLCTCNTGTLNWVSFTCTCNVLLCILHFRLWMKPCKALVLLWKWYPATLVMWQCPFLGLLFSRRTVTWKYRDWLSALLRILCLIRMKKVNYYRHVHVFMHCTCICMHDFSWINY